MKVHGIRLFSVGLAVLSGVIASAQVNAVHTPPAAVDAVPAAEAPAPGAAPVYPKRPAELPPKPPKVTCHGDQLTISAENSTLDAILAAVRGCTGARIDTPEGASAVRSFEELGPGAAREVLDQLLSGTPYNYVIQSSEANPLKVEMVLLSSRSNDAAPGKPGASGSSISADIPMTPGRRAWQRMQKFDKPDPSQLNQDGTVAEQEPTTPAEEATASNSGDSNASTNATDSPAAESAAASTPTPAGTPVAPPILDPNSNTDPAKAMHDRIAAMQQMFAQRQQMMQKQNQPSNGAPNN